MSVIVAEGKVVVEADATGIPKQIADDIEKGSGDADRAGRSVGKSVFGGVVGAWAAIGGTQLVTSWFSGAVSGASDLNETMSKSGAIFGEHSGKINAWSDNAAKTLGLSKSAAMDAAASFGDMFSQIGFTGDAAATMSTSVVQAAADLGSFSNLETADVADRISAAFRGEYDSLQAVIPNINAARVESEALAATGKKTAAELTAQEKATAVLAIVQKDGARAMGDFARTSDGAANSAKIATASLEDQQSKIGAVLLPAWSGFLSFLNTSAIPAFATMVTWVSQNTDTLGMLAATIGIAAAAYGVITAGMGIYAAFTAAQAAATGGLTISQWALNAAMSANPIGIVITLLALLVGAIIWVATQTTFFQDAWTNITNVIGTAWQWLWDTVLNPVFTAIGAVFNWIYNSVIVPVVTGIMIYIGIWAAIITWLYGAVIAPVFAAIGAIFTWVWASVISPIVNFIGGAIRNVGTVISWLGASVVAPTMAAVGGAFSWVWNSVISPTANFIGGAIRTVGSTVQSVFSGMAGFIGQAFQNVVGVIRGPINGIIGLVNSAIRGINNLSVTIPDWVPGVGGQTFGVKLPTIPMLARGSLSSPDTFIAGEEGPELITGRRGSRVYPARDTARMLEDRNGGGDQNINIEINEATDPHGSAGRVALELRKWKAR